ncbi:MAG: hypothetical protein A2Y15_00425 [Clostridiales bacterium GWF2_36_10]|nr:MAG: hypothetical protein A2Y15_00425 [Clostridiales bacterium GWF2_36_10]HAN21745.1 hypothetical protein [Clostridiales bacterium]
MKKPMIILRKQKNIVTIFLSVVIFVVGIFLIFDKNDNDSMPVIAGQNETSSPNKTIADLFGKLMDK